MLIFIRMLLQQKHRQKVQRQCLSYRFTGVSFNYCKAAWEAYVHIPLQRRKQTLGYFVNEKEAAKIVDIACVSQVKSSSLPKGLSSVASLSTLSSSRF